MKDLIAALAGIAVLFILYAIHPILGGIGGFFFLIIWAFFKGFMDRDGAQEKFVQSQKSKANKETDKASIGNEVNYEEGDWTTLDDELSDEDFISIHDMYNEPSTNPYDDEASPESVDKAPTPDITEVDLRFLDPPSWSSEVPGCKAGHYIIDGRKYCSVHLVPYTSLGKCPF